MMDRDADMVKRSRRHHHLDEVLTNEIYGETKPIDKTLVVILLAIFSGLDGILFENDIFSDWKKAVNKPSVDLLGIWNGIPFGG